MGTTADVVAHVNVEQSKRPILFRMKCKPTLVGIPLNLTLNGRTFWRFSHFHHLSFLYVYYTLQIGNGSREKRIFCVKKI